jgi:predicted enzyme related to lactoylglutathione lyase
MSELSIRRVQDGGFLVAAGFHHAGFTIPILFACTDIDEALKYVKRNLTQPKLEDVIRDGTTAN